MRLCSDRPGACYSYRICSKKFLGICNKHEWVEEYFDLSDPNIRAKLIDLGFRLKKD